MRYLLAILFFLPLGLMANSGNFYAYSVHPDSWVSIEGTTNVNNFECMSERQMPRGYILAEALPGKNAIVFSDALLELEINSFDCQNRRMNRDLQDALGAPANPHIRIRLLEAQYVRKNDTPRDQLLVKVGITLNGVVKNTEVMIDFSEKDGYLYLFHGSKEFLMSDFNIDPPSPALGLIKVRDKITITFNLLVEAGLVTQK